MDESDPNQVRLEIVRYFWKLKYPRPQYEALVDHARDESGFRPCATNGSSLRYLYQWSGLRLQRLQAYARTNGCPPLEKQLAFTNYELRHEGNYGCFWEAQTRETALRTLRRGFGQGRC